jgi:tyrosinase
MAAGQNTELVGASEAAVRVTGSAVGTSVRLNPAVRATVARSLQNVTAAALPDRVFIRLENVRGGLSAPVLGVYINLPPGANPDDHPELLAGSVGLFGLRRASAPGGRAGGQGLTFTLEITKIIDALHLRGDLGPDAIDVTIVSANPIPTQAPITIERVSIYRKGH